MTMIDVFEWERSYRIEFVSAILAEAAFADWYSQFGEIVEKLYQQWVAGWRAEHADDRNYLEVVDLGGEA